MKKKENRKTKEIPKLEIHHFQSSSLFHFTRERVARILRKIRKDAKSRAADEKILPD